RESHMETHLFLTSHLVLLIYILLLLFFFFQAEDGIRDRNVTGVQTCALPILYNREIIGHSAGPNKDAALVHRAFSTVKYDLPDRSEERRVGKECRSRRWAEK